jgi:hypothetical protein
VKSGGDTVPQKAGWEPIGPHFVGASQEGRANMRAAAGRERCSAEKHSPSGIAGRDGLRGWRLGRSTRKPGIAAPTQREGGCGPTGVGSTARMDSVAGKVGKVSRVAEALPHSEGAGYKRLGREIPACPRDRRMGS